MSHIQKICEGESIGSERVLSESAVKKGVQRIVSKLMAPGKVMIQLDGSRNVCQTFEYIFDQELDLLENISGIAFELDALTQLVSYVNVNEKLRDKVLLGKTFRTRIYPYQINNGLEMSVFEGFDDLDRRMKKLKVWGCSFVILQVDHGYQGALEGKTIPIDNSFYFGIFSASAQALGMVPIIQFKFDWSVLSEEECEYIFVQTMFGINESFHDFEVEIEGLLVSQLIKYPPMMDPDYNVQVSSEVLVNNLQRALAPAIGGVVFFADGNPKTLAMQINIIVRLIERIPWPIICGYSGKVPVITDTDKEILLNMWFNNQAKKIDMLCMCNKGKLVDWHAKLTMLTDDFIKSHNYYDRFYTK